MHAVVGDQLVRRGPVSGVREIVGTVVDVQHEDRSPTYVIRWYEDGHESEVRPSPVRYRICSTTHRRRRTDNVAN